MARTPRKHTHVHDADEDPDGCLCDIQISANDAVTDADLPEATGGVEAANATAGGEETDGCDVDFEDGQPTGDENLPEARGGVE